MVRAVLNDYYWLKKEIRLLKEEIDSLPSDKNDINQKDYKNLLEEKINKYREIAFQAENFFDSVEDAEIRLILRLRYMKLMTWEEIGKEVFMSSSGAFRKCNKFLDGVFGQE